MKTSDSEEDPVYDVPPNRHLLPEGKTSDHVSTLVTLHGCDPCIVQGYTLLE